MKCLSAMLMLLITVPVFAGVEDEARQLRLERAINSKVFRDVQRERAMHAATLPRTGAHVASAPSAVVGTGAVDQLHDGSHRHHHQHDSRAPHLHHDVTERAQRSHHHHQN